VLASGAFAADRFSVRQRIHAGRLCGGEEFVHRLENMLGRVLRPRETGPKSKFNSWKSRPERVLSSVSR
ncbi:MAG: hypothetical protein KAW17_12250, partial [Candidatus Eisenbacteria sp.]|nr:hypothetical protein [Candidatus Eisenbacteria bacterium]